MSNIHFCSIQLNISETNCCQLIQLLNIPKKIPLCLPKQLKNVLINNINNTFENISNFDVNKSTIFPETSSPIYKKYIRGGGPPLPVMNLKVPPNEAPEEHLIFLFGVFMLISMAVICTLFLMKLTKVNSSSNNIPSRLIFSPRTLARNLASSNYSLMLCIPPRSTNNTNFNNSKIYNRRSFNSSSTLSQRQRRSQTTPLVVLIDSSFSNKSKNILKTKKGLTNNNNNKSISIVSSNSMNALLPQIKPSNTTESGLTLLNASTSNNSFSTNLIPPPCYDELENN